MNENNRMADQMAFASSCNRRTSSSTLSAGTSFTPALAGGKPADGLAAEGAVWYQVILQGEQFGSSLRAGCRQVTAPLRVV